MTALQRFCSVALAESLSTRCTAAGIRPAMAGNFSLLRQRKVTKREALNRTSPRAFDGHRAKTSAQRLSRSEPLRSRCCPCHQPDSATVRAPNVGCTPNSRVEVKRRSGGASAVCSAFTGEPGVQPALTGVKVRSLAVVTGTAARAQRVASSKQDSGRFRARAFPSTRWRAVSASSLVTFFWRSREKLPAIAGRIPAAVHRVERLVARATHKPMHRAERPAATATAQHPGRA